MISPDDHSHFAVASQWVSRIMTVSFEMVLPGLVGLWLDRRVGTLPLLTLVGFGLGVTTAIWHLLQMTSAKPGHPATRGTGQRGDDGR